MAKRSRIIQFSHGIVRKKFKGLDLHEHYDTYLYDLPDGWASDLVSDTQPFSMAVPAGAVLRFPLGG